MLAEQMISLQNENGEGDFLQKVEVEMWPELCLQRFVPNIVLLLY